MTQEAFRVAALYHFAKLASPEAERDRLENALRAAKVKGTILVAAEGINGTIAGSAQGIAHALAALRQVPGCADLSFKESWATEQPFLRLKVRLKKEIVTLGQQDVDVTARVGRYIPPQEWNAVLDDPDIVVIDTRNDFEVSIGSFDGAVDPHTTSFREFPAWYEEFRAENPNKRVAMFCTGGIRCEKASSWLLQQGEDEILHLEGGILRYLEEVPAEESRWHGECFVFDGRVSVTHGLEEGSYTQCYACRYPLSTADVQDPRYQPGVSCPHCYDKLDAKKRAACEERHRQVVLAAARGQQHVGQNG